VNYRTLLPAIAVITCSNLPLLHAPDRPRDHGAQTRRRAESKHPTVVTQGRNGSAQRRWAHVPEGTCLERGFSQPERKIDGPLSVDGSLHTHQKTAKVAATALWRRCQGAGGVKVQSCRCDPPDWQLHVGLAANGLRSVSRPSNDAHLSVSLCRLAIPVSVHFAVRVQYEAARIMDGSFPGSSGYVTFRALPTHLDHGYYQVLYGTWDVVLFRLVRPVRCISSGV
jgi:hypothetical protein